MKPLHRYIDHTLLHPTATPAQIEQLCREAQTHQFYAVCVNGLYVAHATELLHNSGVQVAAVVGFPLGANHPSIKQRELAQALEDGATEIDTVLSIGALKSGDHRGVLRELQLLRQTDSQMVLKVILETALLSQEEKILACELAVDAGTDFVKTSTGFGPGGATLEDVSLMLQTVDGKARVKASGGIRDRATLLQYVELGVDRIGTSSGVAIMNEH